MNITTKIIITDTNIISDLNNCNILEDFVNIDNVYISDLVKLDEINYKTGNIDTINKIKVIYSTEKQLLEVISIKKFEHKLSTYDLLNYIIARDNNCILATGDNRLKIYSENNGIEVIRTLKIIKLMYNQNIISSNKALQACIMLKHCSTTRIPDIYIDNLIKEIEKDSINV